ncbi:MAG TPA: hypothetical protein HA263_05605 [Methanoregulaceae archaeon]|nr:hypothetical protein [Methanoregulaceae archaeon]
MSVSEHRPGIERAYERISELCDPDQANYWRPLLSAVEPCDHSSSLFRRIIQAADNDQLEDCLVEGLFVLYFLDHGFTVSIIPESSKERRPDLRVARGGQTAVVEIKHYRYKDPGPFGKNLDDDWRDGKIPELAPCSDYEHDEKRCHQRLITALEQIFAHVEGMEPFIIAFWNSDNRLDRLQYSSAISSLLQQRKNLLPTRSCGFSLFRSNRIEFLHGDRIPRFFSIPITPSVPVAMEDWKWDLEDTILLEGRTDSIQ